MLVYFIVCPLLFSALDIIFDIIHVTNDLLQFIIYMGLFYYCFPRIERWVRQQSNRTRYIMIAGLILEDILLVIFGNK